MSQVKVRTASDSLGFTVRQVEHVFEEGNHRSATVRVPPFQPVL
jgi:hypothetical protein